MQVEDPMTAGDYLWGREAKTPEEQVKLLRKTAHHIIAVVRVSGIARPDRTPDPDAQTRVQERVEDLLCRLLRLMPKDA